MQTCDLYSLSAGVMKPRRAAPTARGRVKGEDRPQEPEHMVHPHI
jgi:hypothetical protein